jgi:hypothetical protein
VVEPAYYNYGSYHFCVGAIAVGNAQFGQGSELIFLDEVGCVGSESTLIECRANAVGIHDCSHEEDAGVQCKILGLHTKLMLGPNLRS